MLVVQQEPLSLRFLDASASSSTLSVHWDACYLSETWALVKEDSEEAMVEVHSAALSASSISESCTADDL